jgi:hypothetical protein
MLEEEENWVDAGDVPLEDVRVEEQSLEAWSEGENSLEVPTTDELVLEEIESVDTSLSSLELPAGFMAELPADRDPSSPLPLTEELSSESALDFLLELEGDDSPEQDSDLLVFTETNDLESGNLSDLSSELDLDSEAMPLLDMFADDPEILPEFPLTEPGQSDATPFINFLDSTAEKSDAEFLEMLQSEEEDSTMPSPLEESDDIFGDLFHNPAPPSSTEMDGLFSQNHATESPSASDSGLEELFSEDDLFFDNWDQLGTEVAVKES